MAMYLSMDITIFLPLLSALFVFALGIVVLLHGGKSRMNFTFILFTFVIAIWLFGTFMMFLEKNSVARVIFWDKFVYAGVVFVPVILYHFGLALLDDTSRRRRFLLIFGYLASTVFLMLIPTNLFVNGIFVYGWGVHTRAQPLHSVFLAYFATYLLLWFRMVYIHYRRSPDLLELEKVRLIFIGFAFLALGSVGFLPAYGISVYPFSYLSGLVFVTILAYTIFKFQLFDVKIVVAELLTFMIWIAVLIQVVMTDTLQGKVLGGMVLSAVIILGVFLIRSVDREVEQREKIQKLAEELEATNERQEGLIHFIGHEVKGFLTKAEGAFAALIDGDFGQLPEELKPFVEHSLAETRQGVDSVSNILKAANLKKGTVAYTKEPFDLRALAAAAVEKAKLAAEQKGLTLTFAADEASYQMIGDKAQIDDHVLRNLIDNAVNYTPSGSISVSLKREGDKLVFAVKDSGIGITDEDKARLFTEGGHGKDSQTVNVHSTGYGLYIAKQITEAHGGTIRAESEGAGKGSTFTVEFPA